MTSVHHRPHPIHPHDQQNLTTNEQPVHHRPHPIHLHDGHPEETQSKFNPLVVSSWTFVAVSWFSEHFFESWLMFFIGVSSLLYHIRGNYGSHDIYFYIDQIAVATNVCYQFWCTAVQSISVHSLVTLLTIPLYYIFVVKPAKHNTMERKWKHVGVHTLGVLVWLLK